MFDSTPQISILIPTYNRCDLLIQTLKSIQNQSFTDYEIIVTDNCSTDGTAEAIATLRDERIVYQCNVTNVGAVNNYNQALRLARGRYIYFFSDDDLMLDDNLLRKQQVLEQYPSVGLVHSNFHNINGAGEIFSHNHWASTYPPLASIYQKLLSQPLMPQATAFRQLYYEWTFVSMPTVLVRASILQQYSLELNGQLHYLCDWDLWLRISLHTDFYYLPEALVLYRLHQHNEGRMLTPTIYYRELVLSKLGMLNEFKRYQPHDRYYIADVNSVTKHQLKTYGFFESYVQEQARHFKGYLKKKISPSTLAWLKDHIKR